jgi:hypothetical protein
VRVHVHETRKNGLVGQVDRAHAVRSGARGHDVLDDVAPDDDAPVVEDSFADDVDEPAGAQHDDVSRAH